MNETSFSQFAGFGKGGSGKETASQETDLTSGEIKKYDFKHPKLVSKENLRALRNIHELLARNLDRIFTDSLNQKVDVSLHEIEEVIYSEFLSELEPPTALFLFNIEELGDWALMELDPTFCLYCIERQGGSRENTSRPARALTRIEERIISRTINKIFKELTHVWSPYLQISILNHVYESRPGNIRTISSHIPGIIIRYRLSLQNMTVPLKFCYPFALLKEQLNDPAGNPGKKGSKGIMNNQEKKNFENYLKRVDVPVKARLGKTKISMSDLLQLDKGDVIKLNQPIDQPLDVLVNGAKKMVGYPGNMGGNRSVKIFKVINSLKPNEEI